MGWKHSTDLCSRGSASQFFEVADMADKRPLAYNRRLVGKSPVLRRTNPAAAMNRAGLTQDPFEKYGVTLNAFAGFALDILDVINSERHKKILQAARRPPFNTPGVIDDFGMTHQTPTPPPQPETPSDTPSDTYKSGSQSKQGGVLSTSLGDQLIKLAESIQHQNHLQAAHTTGTSGRPTKFFMNEVRNARKKWSFSWSNTLAARNASVYWQTFVKNYLEWKQYRGLCQGL
ncbi:hypothetical protein J3E72DRAFT_273704 [Bipolaris maydis]|nr:hypothetical protein J3E72DRAFT_273704 [Bipolaris maydis]